jgi:acetolactate synthase-1/2/3 large subunit
VPKYLDKKKDLSAPCAAVRKEVQQAMAPQQQAADILGAIRQEIGEDGIVVVDVTQINHACLELLPVHHPHTYVSSGYQGALGFGPCTAMGMKIGRPDVPVVCLIGDGGFMYAAQELATAVQFNIPVIMLIINNNSYRNVEGILNNAYGGRAIATSLQNPDFVAFAASFGVEARRVTTTREMQAALKEFVACNIPAVIDYRLDHLESPFWLRFLPQVRKQVPENPHGLVK